MRSNIIVFGGNSDILQSIIDHNSFSNHTFHLFCRSYNAKHTDKNINIISGKSFTNEDHQVELLEYCNSLDNISHFIFSYGVLGDSALETHNIDMIISTNLYSKIRLASALFNSEKFRNAHFTFFGSPAADRPRKVNFIYGSSIKSMDFFLEGALLAYPHLKILNVKFGPIETKLTSHLENKFLFSHTNKIKSKLSFLISNQSCGTYYLPLMWKYIIFIVKLIPNFIFKRLNF